MKEQKPQIRVQSTSHRAATKAAAGFDMTLGEFTEAALDYFTSRQLNPADEVAREGQLIMQQVKKLGDRLFSFHQVQERGLLVPMLHEMLRSRITLDRVLRMSEILVNNLTRQLEQLTPDQIEKQKASLQKLRQQNEDMIERLVQEALNSTTPEPLAKSTATGKRGKNEPQSS